MRADADEYEIFRLHRAEDVLGVSRLLIGVRVGIAQIAGVFVGFDDILLIRRAANDEDRPATPQHDDLLARLHLRNIDIHRRARRQRVARRIHARDQRPHRAGRADAGDGRSGDREKIASRPAVVTMRRHRPGLRGIRHEFPSHFRHFAERESRDHPISQRCDPRRKLDC